MKADEVPFGDVTAGLSSRRLRPAPSTSGAYSFRRPVPCALLCFSFRYRHKAQRRTLALWTRAWRRGCAEVGAELRGEWKSGQKHIFSKQGARTTLSGKRAIRRSSAARKSSVLYSLSVAISLDELDVPGYRLHALSGTPKRWSIRVDKNWRIDGGLPRSYILNNLPAGLGFRRHFKL